MNETSISERLEQLRLRLVEAKKHCGLIPVGNTENVVNNTAKASSSSPTQTAPQNYGTILKETSIENANDSMVPTQKKLANNATKAVPRFLGFGEYEERKKKYIDELKADYKCYLEQQKENKPTKIRKHNKVQKEIETSNFVDRNLFLDHASARNVVKNPTVVTQGVQTDIQGIDICLVVKDNNKRHNHKTPDTPDITDDKDEPMINAAVAILEESQEQSDDQMSDRGRANQLALKIDKVEIGTQNIIVPGGQSSYVPSLENMKDVTRNLGGSPRERLLSDLKHSYYPSFCNGANQPNRDQLNNKLKWDQARQRDEYQEELRKQIEEKQRLALEAAERERQKEVALTRRLERQLMQLKAESELEKAKQAAKEERSRMLYEDMWQRHQELENRNAFSHEKYIPKTYNVKSQVSSIRSDKDVPYSFNIPAKSLFGQRVHSNEYLDDYDENRNRTFNIEENYRKRYIDEVKHRSIEDSIPVLRAKSPAHDQQIVNIDQMVPNSPAMQQVEAKWMVPAVQKNIVRNNSVIKNDGKNVLTQLGAIRLQLQQEQLRLNEKLQQKIAENKSRVNNLNR